MREYNLRLNEFIREGLRKHAENPRNSSGLIQCDGIIPEYESLTSLETPTRLTMDAVSATFPYPQVFVLKQVVLVCISTAIYTYSVSGDTLTLAIDSLTPGVTWSCADFGNFIILVNGKEVVTRDGADLTWSKANSLNIPTCTSIVNVNGQAILCGPDTIVPNSDI